MPELSEPKIIERGPYLVVGAYCTFEGEDEGPGWSGASNAFYARREEITNSVGDAVLGFLYWPHKDHPDIPELKYFNLSTVGQWFQGLKPSNISLFFIPGRNSATVKIPNRKFDEISFGSILPFDTTFTYNVIKESAKSGESIEIEVSPIEGLGKGTRLSSLTFEVERSGEKKPAIFSIPLKLVRY